MHAPLPRRPARARPRSERVGTYARRPITPIRHVTLPFCVTAAEHAEPGETIGGFLARVGWATRVGRAWAFRLPTICVVNGRPVLQRVWKRLRVRAGDVVEFWSRPWGGSNSAGGNTGKQVAGIVALIALAAFASWIVGPAALALTGVTASIVSGVIVMGGSLLIAALTRPKPGGQNDDAVEGQDQVNSVAASGNQARLFQPRPVQYGRVKSFPDFAITPWSEFGGQTARAESGLPGRGDHKTPTAASASNDQFLNVLLSVSEGRLEYEALTIDDTILWTPAGGVDPTFSDVSIDFYDPDETVTLFPTNVVQSSEVSGQELPSPSVGDWIGGFIATASGTTATDIAIDLVFPAGMWYIDSNGMHTASASLSAEYRPVDGAGAPTGLYESLWSQSFVYSTRTPQRVSVKTPVVPGRYQVRLRRNDEDYQDATFQSGASGANTVVWVGLRAFIQGPSSFPVSTVAIRIKANSQLTQSSARKFGVLATRVLDVWSPGTETFVPTATRNPFWAAYDAATNSDYGVDRPPSKVDFQTIVDQAAAADQRGDTFDYRFVSAVPAPEALDMILRGSRARHRWSGDVLTFVRDEWSDVPRMLLTDREIARGSFSVEYALNVDDSSDAVIVEYLDENTWGPAEVQYPPDTFEFTALAATRIRLDGVVNREHAHREAGFYYLQSQYRRVTVTLDTEHDGRMLGYGSRVRVQSELPLSWGYTGSVESRSVNTLLVSPAPTWALVGNHYIAIRTKTGRQFGPVLCTQGVDAAHVVLNAADLAAVENAQGRTLENALTRADGADDPSFDFGVGDSRARDCIVMSGRPSKDRVTLGLVVDKLAVHETDLGEVPVAPSVPALRDPTSPLITSLYASFDQGVAEPVLNASWWPAAGAQYYVAQVSYDALTSSTPSWIFVYEGTEPKFSQVVDRAGLRLRVQGVGERTGAFSFVDVEAPTIVIAPGTVAQSSLEAGLRDYVTNELKRVTDAVTQVQQLIASIAAEQDAANWIDKKQVRTDLVAARGALSASITSVQTVAVTTESALAAIETTVQAASGEGLAATVSENFTAVATINGSLAAQWLVTLDVNGYVSGVRAFNDGTTSIFTIIADNFRIAAPGQAGGDPVSVFQLGVVGGVSKLALRGDMLVDGTITAAKISAGAIIAGKIAAGAVNATNILAQDIIVTGNLRADAATAVSYVLGGNIVSTFTTTGQVFNLATLVFNVAVGRVLVDGLAEVFSNPLLSLAERLGLELLIDGSVVKTHTIAFDFVNIDDVGGSNIKTFAFVRRPYPILYLATGLSVGNHTFTLRLTAQSGWTRNAILFQAIGPALRVMESRR